MVSVVFMGRLSNNIIQFIAGYFLSKKKNTTLHLQFPDFFIKNNDSNATFHEIIIKHIYFDDFEKSDFIRITDDNFMEVYKNEDIHYENYLLEGFFQNKTFLEPIREDVKKLLEIEYSNRNSDDVFVHYRLGDVDGTEKTLPLEYFIEALDILGSDGGFLSSDSLDHPNCKYLIDNYNLIPVNFTPWDTIVFAKDFNNIVLSEGTFSALIGFLSKASKIVCNNRELKWAGDFCDGLDSYIKLSWGYHNGKSVNYKKN
jgi:hypothetical protein